jgi:hypothetical protein
MDSRLQHTSLVIELASLTQEWDQPEDNEFRPETPAVGNAETKEMKSAVLSWERMDIFLSHGGANDEDDCW